MCCSLFFSPVIFILLTPNLFLDLYNHPLRTVNGLLSLVAGITCWSLRRSSVLSCTTCRLKHIFCSCLPPACLMPFPFRLSTYHTLWCNSAVCGTTAKPAWISSNLLHNFTEIKDLFLPTSTYNFFSLLVVNFHLSA